MNKSDKFAYITKIIEVCKKETALIDSSFNEILSAEYRRFLGYIEIPRGVGKNTALQENIFVIYTCIMNNLPLIISGKPGSTKTLAMNLILKSMKGQNS